MITTLISSKGVESNALNNKAGFGNIKDYRFYRSHSYTIFKLKSFIKSRVEIFEKRLLIFSTLKFVDRIM